MHHLKDYRPPAYWIQSVHLQIDIREGETEVESSLTIERNLQEPKGPLVLQGENIDLKSIHLDGRKLQKGAYQLTEKMLTLAPEEDKFTLKITNTLSPENNKALSGLYRSNHMYCTQCEAQGFRRITYFLDRPDVMAKFTTRIEAEKKFPVLLSNGHLMASGDLPEGRHFAVFEDPFPKPCYLFALVAGNLIGVEDHFLTCSNRLVKLKLYVEHENLGKTAHAMQALKKAMAWDEKAYHREYDLDTYTIVATNDFNMGAMENKGLNIFNAKYILASQETATDLDFQHIDDVVAHEYCHNWSGNRVTCRDWFQLSLKEGLTVFREHHFSRENSQSPVALIQNVKYLRTHQFAEDASPMSHPVQPQCYESIDNFYTVTVYEKGAEVIRMMQTLVGEKTFQSALDYYFEVYDGQAVTIDELIKSVEHASGRDLTQFKLWYTQSGTPEVRIESEYDQAKQTLTLNMTQHLKKNQKPMHIPIQLGLIDDKGKDLIGTTLCELTEPDQTFAIQGVKSQAVVSLLRNFSAPINITYDYSEQALAHLLCYDHNAFSQWNASVALIKNHTVRNTQRIENNQAEEMSENILDSFKKVLEAEHLNAALKAEIFSIPSITACLEWFKQPIDIDMVCKARKFLIETFAKCYKKHFEAIYEQYDTRTHYVYEAQAVGERALKNTCLYYLVQNKDKKALEICLNQYQQSDNMTDTMGALVALNTWDCQAREETLAHFHQRFSHDLLVIDKWLALQACANIPEALNRVKALCEHPDFSIKNPNNVYALLVGFARNNLEQFHHQSGQAYEFIAEKVLEIDAFNPQVSSRLVSSFLGLNKVDEARQKRMRQVLETIAKKKKLSSECEEIIKKCLSPLSDDKG